MQQFEGSLRRLQTSYVDIIQIHEADFLKWWTDDIRLDLWSALIKVNKNYDFADAPVVQFLEDARSSGKARFIGLTGKNARLLARIMRKIQVDSVMVAHQFNPIYRNASEFLFPVANELECGMVIGAPLMKGWLAVPQEEWRDNPPDWMDAPFKQSYFGFIDIRIMRFQWLNCASAGCLRSIGNNPLLSVSVIFRKSNLIFLLRIAVHSQMTLMLR